VTVVEPKTVLVGETALRAVTRNALAAATGQEVEVLVLARDLGLTRFANSEIHQNMRIATVDLRIRVVRDRRVATVWTNRLDDEGVAKAALDASEKALVSPENPEWGGLPEAEPYPHVEGFDDETAATTPERRARMAGAICDPAYARKLRAAGYVATTVTEIAVANSHGVWAYHPATIAETQAVVLGEAGSGYAGRLDARIGRIDADAVAREALDRSIRAQDPRDFPAGQYEVVLEPYAVADVIEFLGEALTGLALEEGSSFVGGKFGDKVTGEQVSLVDDPLDLACMPRPFDFEGARTQRVALVERGVARGVVYDSQTAARNKARNTGHAFYSSEAYPYPMHLRMEPGRASRDELLRGVKRGVLITRFWYTRWVHPLRTIVTGMTRDGVFAIEDGEVAYPVRNFRFTQSYHEALGTTLAIEKELALQRVDRFTYGFDAGFCRVPAVRLGTFTFTGTTQY
jgi:predicted Zn-dependent protease